MDPLGTGVQLFIPIRYQVGEQVFIRDSVLGTGKVKLVPDSLRCNA